MGGALTRLDASAQELQPLSLVYRMCVFLL